MNQAEDPHKGKRTNKPSPSAFYEIRVQGQLDSNWSNWFDGLVVAAQENGETLIAGPIPDQAVLQGILSKVFNLRLPLLSVKRIHPGPE